MSAEKLELKNRILSLVKEYYTAAHTKAPFVPGKTRINYAGRVYDEKELVNLVDSSLDFWLTAGPYAQKFESRMRTFFKARDFLLVNSGSSANLLMVSTLCSKQLQNLLKKDQDPPVLEAGDEVITPSVTFPTTLTPIIQNQLVPVFVDCAPGTYNINPDLLEQAVGPGTRAIFVPHTLGLPCDLDRLTDFARRHRLWLLEDGCDALGGTYDGKLVGTFGAMSSLSFFPAHHMTMGEGGGVAVNHPALKNTVRSIRDWGRDCWCEPGVSNTCGKRFDWQLGELPAGYDHKYIYSNLGYNLKVTDMQAAIGLAQADKIESFVAARRSNFRYLYENLKHFEDRLVLPVVDPKADPSPFGFPVTVRDGIRREDMIRFLEDAQIETRLIFGGNILRQPGFLNIKHRVAGPMEESDRIMRDAFFVGVFPGMTREMLDYVVDRFTAFLKQA